MKFNKKFFRSILALLIPIILFLLGDYKLDNFPAPVEPNRDVLSGNSNASGVSPSITPTIVASQSAELIRVQRIIDGDTVVLENGQKLRYIGIDTPERNECFYKEAMEENKKLVEGKEVRLEKDKSETDKYGRLLRYVWVDNTMINELLVREGFAVANSYKPDIGRQNILYSAENFAKGENRGLWGSCN